MDWDFLLAQGTGIAQREAHCSIKKGHAHWAFIATLLRQQDGWMDLHLGGHGHSILGPWGLDILFYSMGLIFFFTAPAPRGSGAARLTLDDTGVAETASPSPALGVLKPPLDFPERCSESLGRGERESYVV